jgi:hypothetical protein
MDNLGALSAQRMLMCLSSTMRPITRACTHAKYEGNTRLDLYAPCQGLKKGSNRAQNACLSKHAHLDGYTRIMCAISDRSFERCAEVDAVPNFERADLVTVERFGSSRSVASSGEFEHVCNDLSCLCARHSERELAAKRLLMCMHHIFVDQREFAVPSNGVHDPHQLRLVGCCTVRVDHALVWSQWRAIMHHEKKFMHICCAWMLLKHGETKTNRFAILVVLVGCTFCCTVAMHEAVARWAVSHNCIHSNTFTRFSVPLCCILCACMYVDSCMCIACALFESFA